mgnify:CR=1 FL=1
MTIGAYIGCAFLVVIGLVGLIANIISIQGKAKKELLNTLFKKNEITSDTYKKYIDNV